MIANRTSRRPARCAARLGTLAALFALALSPLANAQVADRWGPTPVMSTEGHRVDELFWIITALISASFVIVLVMLVVPVLKHRARPGHKASYDHGASLHDKRFTAVVSVTVFLVLDASVLWIAMHDLREAVYAIPEGEDVYRVQVLGQQWSWNFRAPGVDGEFGTPDDIVTINHLHVPENRPVSLELASKDVIHSFFLPDMRIKRDANPGAINRTWFQAKEGSAGDYDILCAELCGFAHYQMHGTLTVVPSARFAAWEREASAIALATHDPNDTEARWAWTWKE